MEIFVSTYLSFSDLPSLEQLSYMAFSIVFQIFLTHFRPSEFVYNRQFALKSTISSNFISTPKNTSPRISFEMQTIVTHRKTSFSWTYCQLYLSLLLIYLEKLLSGCIKHIILREARGCHFQSIPQKSRYHE
jgi:hypothetical protein